MLGEAEINAAASTMAMFLSPVFDFRKVCTLSISLSTTVLTRFDSCLLTGQTYWLIAGIAGVNPYQGTLGSVTFSRFAVQVALQYELDARQMPSNWSTGYWNYGTSRPGIAQAPDDLCEYFVSSTSSKNFIL